MASVLSPYFYPAPNDSLDANLVTIVRTGNLKALKMLAQGLSAVTRARAVLLAAKYGDTDILRYLLNTGYVDFATLNGALHQAVLSGVTQNIEMLRTAGASKQWCGLDHALCKMRKQIVTRSLSGVMEALA